MAVIRTPHVEFLMGPEKFVGEARFLEDAIDRERVGALVRSKYRLAAPLLGLTKLFAALGLVTYNYGAFEVSLSGGRMILPPGQKCHFGSTASRIRIIKAGGVKLSRSGSGDKIAWQGGLLSGLAIDPFDPLVRSAQPYLPGLRLKVRGMVGSEAREFLVAGGQGAHGAVFRRHWRSTASAVIGDLPREPLTRNAAAASGDARMPVEMIIDQWNPSRRRYRTETFC